MHFGYFKVDNDPLMVRGGVPTGDRKSIRQVHCQSLHHSIGMKHTSPKYPVHMNLY